MAARRALSCLLALGLAAPVLAAARPASAEGAVSGIVVDTAYADGLLLNSSSSLLSPTYEATASVVGAVTTFRTRAVSSGTYSGPQVSIAPPTSAATLAPGHYTTAGAAADALAGLVVKQSQSCAGASEGTLDVVDVAYTGGQLSSLAAAWSYRCVGSAAWAFGEVRFASPTGVTSGSQTRFLQLGNTGVGTTTPAKPSVLRNNGTLPLTFGSAQFTGDNPGDFAVSTDTCSGQTLAVGATCSVSVTSTPTTAGYRAAVLQVSDGSARGFRNTEVSSVGLTAPSVPQNVTATQATDGVAVTWASPADTGGTAVTGFQVYRGATADDLTLLGETNRLRLGDVLSGTTSADTAYVYAVKAVNAIGTSPLSSTTTGSTPASVAVPAATGLLSLDIAPGYAPGYADPSTLHRDRAAGDTVTVAVSSPEGLYLNAGRTGEPNLAVTLHVPTGAAVQAGTFPLATTQDATNGTVSVTGFGGHSYCPPGAGTASITRLERTAAGDVAFLDADLSFACGLGTGLHRLSTRIGTDTPYTEVQVPDVAAGDVAVGTTKTVPSSYTNTGTTSVTVTGVTLSGSAGGPAVDWSLADGGATCVGTVLSPAASCTTDVQVSPTAGGSRPASIVYADSTPAGTHTRHLTANGALVPVAPSSFSFFRQAGKVTLSWNGMAPEAGRAPTSWSVLVGPDVEHLSPLATVTSPTVTDPSTADGYRLYRVVANNAAGTSPGADFAIDAGLDAPSVTGFVTTKSLVLVWAAGSKVPSDPVTGYRVYRGATPTSLSAVGELNATRFTTTPPATGVHAYFAVAPILGATIGPRSAILDLVGTSTQLVVATLKTASSTIDIRGTNGGTAISLPESNPGYPQIRAEVAVSPKGTQVAYVQASLTTAEFDDIWIRNVDGSGTPLRVTSTGTLKEGLAWSPDGTKTAFSDYGATSSVLRVVTSSGSLVTTVPSSTDLSSPSWLDNGTLVAEDDSSFTAPLVRVLAATGARTALAGTAAGLSPAVRPGSAEVAFLLPTGADDYDLIRVLNLKTGAIRAIAGPANSYLSTPSWTRDGSRLYAAANGDVVSAPSNGTGTFSRTYSSDGDVLSVAVSTPDTTGPTGVKLAGVPTYTLGTSVTPTFSATDALNGIASYTVLYRRAAFNTGFGAASAVTVTAPRAIAVAKGYTYCFSVRATDGAGNVSATTAEQCAVVPMDDRSLARSSAFTLITSSAYYASTAMRTTAKGATLTRTGVTSAKQLFLVVATCTTCGTLDVLVGSTRVASVNLYSASTVNKKVIVLPSFSARSGTVTLRVTSTARTVLVDGVGVRT